MADDDIWKARRRGSPESHEGAYWIACAAGEFVNPTPGHSHQHLFAGARVRAKNPPTKGSEVFLVVEGLDVYGRIVWKSGELCGLRLEDEMRAFDVELLRRDAAGAADRRLTPEEKGGAEDWEKGLAR